MRRGYCRDRALANGDCSLAVQLVYPVHCFTYGLLVGAYRRLHAIILSACSQGYAVEDFLDDMLPVRFAML